jgi:large subunit ribosomal protein L6
MKKEFFQKIEIPEDVDILIIENEIIVKGKEGENKRKFNFHNLEIEKKDNNLIIGCKKATKREKKMTNTFVSHIRNMIKGVQEKFEYLLKVCSSHFPITVKIEDNKIIIKNFLGEKIDRILKFPEDVEVKINSDIIKVNSIDKELAGQTAADLEKITKIRNKDRRIFQDGIFIINKAGVNI